MNKVVVKSPLRRQAPLTCCTDWCTRRLTARGPRHNSPALMNCQTQAMTVPRSLNSVLVDIFDNRLVKLWPHAGAHKCAVRERGGHSCFLRTQDCAAAPPAAPAAPKLSYNYKPLITMHTLHSLGQMVGIYQQIATCWTCCQRECTAPSSVLHAAALPARSPR